jgi:hypothetical protein
MHSGSVSKLLATNCDPATFTDMSHHNATVIPIVLNQQSAGEQDIVAIDCTIILDPTGLVSQLYGG